MPHDSYFRVRVQSVNALPDRTKQSFKDQCDIHQIIDRYDRTGLITHLNSAQAHYGDVSGLNDYQDVLDRIKEAEAVFDKLPAKTREAFNNSAAEFLDAANDPDKRDLLRDHGLLGEDEPHPAASSSAPETPVNSPSTSEEASVGV